MTQQAQEPLLRRLSAQEASWGVPCCALEDRRRDDTCGAPGTHLWLMRYSTDVAHPRDGLGGVVCKAHAGTTPVELRLGPGRARLVVEPPVAPTLF